MPQKRSKNRSLKKGELNPTIKKQVFRLQIDLRRALLPHIILLYIKHRPHYSFELHKKISSFASGSAASLIKDLKLATFDQWGAEIGKNVIYNNLNKLEKKGILGSFKKKSDIGAERKYYHLTEFGEEYFDEVIMKRLYPRMLALLSFMQAAFQTDKKKYEVLKKDIKVLETIVGLDDLMR